MTWDAVSLVREISSATPTGWLSSRSSRERSWSLRTSSAGLRTGGLVGSGLDLADQRTEFLEDVIDGLDEPGTVADQAMAAAAGDTVDRTGDGEDLAVLLHGMVGGGERAAPRRGLDHDHAEA